MHLHRAWFLLLMAIVVGSAAGTAEPGEQRIAAAPAQLHDEDFSVREGDFNELLSELDKVIKENEQQFVSEKDREAYIKNWRVSNKDVYRFSRYLWLADPARAQDELLAKFIKAQFSTTRWLLSGALKDCDHESILDALGRVCRQEKHPPYRFDLLNAYVHCSAWSRLRTYSEALSDKRATFSGEFGGGGPAIGTCSNLATRELARMFKMGPAVSEKDRGLDIDGRDAERWRDWFAQNGPYLRLDKSGCYFWVDEDAKACGVPIRDWDRLFWEKQDELTRKAGRRLPSEIPGETDAGKMERLVCYLEKGSSFIDRRGAAVRLGRMGADAKAAIPALEKRQKQDESQAVREAAKAALDHLQAVPVPQRAKQD